MGKLYLYLLLPSCVVRQCRPMCRQRKFEKKIWPGIRGPLHFGAPWLCPPCPSHCYATDSSAEVQFISAAVNRPLVQWSALHSWNTRRCASNERWQFADRFSMWRNGMPEAIELVAAAAAVAKRTQWMNGRWDERNLWMWYRSTEVVPSAASVYDSLAAFILIIWRRKRRGNTAFAVGKGLLAFPLRRMHSKL